MRIKGVVIFGLAGGVVLLWLGAGRLAGREAPAIVPQPEHLEVRSGSFNLGPGARIQVEGFCRGEGDLLAQRLRTSTGYPLPVVLATALASKTIRLTAEGAKAELGPEGYELEVSPENVTIRAASSAGIFYGTQSLLQLLPPRIFSPYPISSQAWAIPCVRVADRPRFAWRGFMLDVSRHFFSTPEIKQLLDAMALHKLNTFHWHLTDDQGWRIEIKRYPRLTQVGAWRRRIGFNLDPRAATAYGPNGRYGGFYTQAEIREIVAYAQLRHITIVPEIDLPGHSSAALAAYPQFSCSGGPYTTDMSEATSPGVYCAGNEKTFQFLQDVLAEVMDLFPGKFIHLGGDEVCVQNWRNCPRCRALMAREGFNRVQELQGYFVKRIQTFVRSRGKRVIGWSEIGTCAFDQSTALMDWIGGGLEAARAGHDVVMSPEAYCYLDFYQSKNRSAEAPAAGAFLPLEKVYSFEPIPRSLEPSRQSHILGAQGNLWTEYIPSLAQVEYMTFPRLTALSEVLWSPKACRNLSDFKRRLAVQEQRMDQLGINYRRNGRHR